MRTITVSGVLLLCLHLSACSSAFLQPEIESRRMTSADRTECTITVVTTEERTSRPCTEIERIESLFESVAVNRTTLADLRTLGFGPPRSGLEVIPSPEIRSRLTKTTDGGMEMLDVAVQACITQADAAYRCQMALFTDSYQRSRGANNPLARLVGLNKVDVVSGWSWEASFVLERTCSSSCAETHEHEYVVRYKQLRHTEDPPTKRKKRLSILDSNPIDISMNP